MQELVTKAAFINLEDLENFFLSAFEKLLNRTSRVDLPVTVKHNLCIIMSICKVYKETKKHDHKLIHYVYVCCIVVIMPQDDSLVKISCFVTKNISTIT